LPEVTNPDQLGKIWLAGTYRGADDFWNPAPDGHGGGACYGVEACHQAYYTLQTTHDVDLAKQIAATYCLINTTKCAKHAASYQAVVGNLWQSPLTVETFVRRILVT
jgi:hypothetical protein